MHYNIFNQFTMSYHVLDDQVRVLVEGGVMRAVTGAAPSMF